MFIVRGISPDASGISVAQADGSCQAQCRSIKTLYKQYSLNDGRTHPVIGLHPYPSLGVYLAVVPHVEVRVRFYPLHRVLKPLVLVTGMVRNEVEEQLNV
jgi:hypothetical protein